MKQGEKWIILTGVFAMALGIQNSASQTRERSEIPVQHTWKLEDIYPSDEAWKTAKDAWVSRLDQILPFKGRLSRSSKDLLACLELNADLSKEFVRLFSYANMRSDQDTRNADAMAMKQEMAQLGTQYETKASYIESELTGLNGDDIARFIQEQPGLGIFEFYLRDVLRRKAHKLSDREEKIIAEAGLLSGAAGSIYNIFSNAELPYPEVVLSDGSKALLNQAGYSKYRAHPNRADREKVFQAFWGALDKFRRTFGSQLYANIKKDLFYARVRGYNSCLESALDENAIPAGVYHALINNVNQNLDSFHRYLKIKKRMLGVDTLKYSDLYAPTVAGVELKYDIEQAKTLVLESVKPLGKDYADGVKLAFENRWIDIFPSPGKRSGAYSNGSVYDVHPYILLNYNGQFQDVSTLAHELGHTMHSYFSNKTQPYPLSNYSIFVAEVASTLNEALLMDRMLKTIKDDDVRLSLLMEYLDSIKGTVFRQTQFAEFEWTIHEIAEKDQPLTGDVLTNLYRDLLKKYYGHDLGICVIEEPIPVEWAYIPHFYYNFYVYQYSTSFTASTALAERVLQGEKKAVPDVLAFLSAGGSRYPIDLLRDAGVDMTSPDPFTQTMQAMNRTMNEIEKILFKKGI
ncbi:oligoendopeptidase F [bacterium]|nr:oligoendopeptidase F [bacterium]